jgi:tetratricopeptide (TPR) repeat protein
MLARLALAALFVGLWLSPVRAQQDTRAAEKYLAAADVSLKRGQFEKVLKFARVAIEAGTRSGSELAPFYLLEARASAGMRNAEGALRAFTNLLALAPEFKLEKTAPPEQKAPYLEARKFWKEHGQRLEASAKLADDLSGLVLVLNDPTEMVVMMRVRLRLLGKVVFSEEVRPPEARNLFVLAGLKDVRALEYSLALYDVYGNRVWERGSDVQPARLDAPVQVITATLDEPAAAPVVEARSALPYYVAGGVALGLGAGAAAGGLALHLKHDEVRLGSGILYGAGGVALAAGVVLLLMAPRGQSTQSAALACAGGPGVVGLACRVGF